MRLLSSQAGLTVQIKAPELSGLCGWCYVGWFKAGRKNVTPTDMMVELRRTGTDRVMMSYEHERVEKDPEKRGYLESGYKKRNRNTHIHIHIKEISLLDRLF